ncbi:hypothetical protein QL989_03755 [Pseudoalteromonas sp. APC 3224]|uniref:hypothetical protein n=1 Tax=Pseudoalteromonas sp. APC 3224 TaxID=3035203 RepID=UPI0025B61A29|nr:hypothetical protein [Pseudoalteromonas sp. APC 3224]MDN3484457.1 hypothetical protein [Pseudoalteromonas sp. APC 3224]
MKTIIAGLRNVFSQKDQNPFVKQWQSFKSNLAKGQSKRTEQTPWIVCIGQESGSALSQLLDIGIELSEKQSIKIGLEHSSFGVYRDCTIHIMSNLPSNAKTYAQLIDFYQQSVTFNELILFSIVTAKTINESSLLMHLLSNKRTFIQDTGASNFEVILSLSDEDLLMETNFYLTYCEKAKEENKVTISLNEPLEQQLYTFELQRRDCLIICDPQDYLNTVSFISNVVSHIEQIHKTLVTVEPNISKVNYFFSPLNAFDAITRQA